MKVWMSVSATKYYDAPDTCNYGYMYISVDGMPDIHVKLSYKEARRQLLKLSKTMGRLPLMSNNQYNPMITTCELYGFIDRE